MANRFGPKGLQMRDVNAVRGLLTGFRNQLHGLIKLKDCCAIELKNQENLYLISWPVGEFPLSATMQNLPPHLPRAGPHILPAIRHGQGVGFVLGR